MIPGERTDGAQVPDDPGASHGAATGSPEAETPQAGAEVDEVDPLDTPERRARQEAWRGLDEGSIMTAELLTATLVWFGVGWLLDRLLGTMPWFMFAGVLLGNWTGLYLIWLRGQRNTEREAARAARPLPGSSDHGARTTRSTAGRPPSNPTASSAPDGARDSGRPSTDRTTSGDS
jgi:ATP synthase protein I